MNTFSRILFFLNRSSSFGKKALHKMLKSHVICFFFLSDHLLYCSLYFRCSTIKLVQVEKNTDDWDQLGPLKPYDDISSCVFVPAHDTSVFAQFCIFFAESVCECRVWPLCSEFWLDGRQGLMNWRRSTLVCTVCLHTVRVRTSV